MLRERRRDLEREKSDKVIEKRVKGHGDWPEEEGGEDGV